MRAIGLVLVSLVMITSLLTDADAASNRWCASSPKRSENCGYATLDQCRAQVVRVREYAAELVRLAPDVILATGTPNVAALKQATTSIPIVFAVVNDPVAQGFIASMAHPGGNIKIGRAHV